MLGALITIDVHARDVVQELVEAGEEQGGRFIRCLLTGRRCCPRRPGGYMRALRNAEIPAVG
jgi:hypothetical protein